MYKNFFGFSEEPFRPNPDPAFLYMAVSHREAFSTMTEGIRERKGIILITGDAGTGKTTLIHALLKDLSEQIKTAFIFFPRLSFNQLLKAILMKLGVPVTGEETDTLLYRFNEYIREKSAADETVVILIDEAQAINPKVLADLNRLLQREAVRTKVLQILLVGQLELEAHLDSAELRQFKQGIQVQLRIRPLSREESEGYIDHRLKKVGSDSSSIFTPEALQLICGAAKGIPRVINLICDAALFEGYNNASRRIGTELVRKALVENQIIAGEEALEAPEILREEEVLQRKGIAGSQEPSAEEEDIPAPKVVTVQGAHVGKDEIAGGKPAFVREAAPQKKATGEKATLAEMKLPRFREAKELRPDRSLLKKIGVWALIVSSLVLSAVIYWAENTRVSTKEGDGFLSPVREKEEKEVQEVIPQKEPRGEISVKVEEFIPKKEQRKEISVKKEEFIPEKEERESTSVRVEKGWTLAFLAKRHYGAANPSLVDLILEANPQITDVNLIHLNQVIKIPRIKEGLLLSQATPRSYRIHLGTFADQSQARIFQNEPLLGGKKLETLSRKVSSQQAWHRILAGEFKSKEEAVKTIQALKKKDLLPVFSGRAYTQ